MLSLRSRIALRFGDSFSTSAASLRWWSSFRLSGSADGDPRADGDDEKDAAEPLPALALPALECAAP